MQPFSNIFTKDKTDLHNVFKKQRKKFSMKPPPYYIPMVIGPKR